MADMLKRLVWCAGVLVLLHGAVNSGVARGDIIIDISEFEDAPDPNGLYIFHVRFQPNPPPSGPTTPGEEIILGNSFTVDNIQHGFPGLDTSGKPTNWGSSITQVGGTPTDPTYNVKFSYVGTIPLTTNTDLGFFTYEVTAPPDGGLPITLPYTWITTLNGQPKTGSGTITVVAVVPEPSPAVLMGVVAVVGLLTGAWRIARTHRQALAAGA
jgi:hypothetical protein